MLDEPTLENALTDVRKAYRLLWCYQKRVFEIIKLFVEEFDDMTFYNWRTLHSDHPCRTGTNPIGDRWTWDMLPMVRVSYLFLPSGSNPNATLPGQWMLEISVDSDSGFSEPEDGSEPDPDDFKDARESTSTVALFAWCCRAATPTNWYGGVWNVLDWPEVDGEKLDHADPPFTVFRRDFDLTTLPDKDAVRAAAASFRVAASKALSFELA